MTGLPAPPLPAIRRRQQVRTVQEAASAAGYTPLQQRLLAGRLSAHQATEIRRAVRPQVADLDHYGTLPDIDRAAERLVRAIVREENVLPVTDHDADGVSSHAVIRAAMLEIFHHPPDKLHSYCSVRKTEGYGVSESLAKRIVADGHRDGVVLTADQGSSDGARITWLRQQGLETIVTDHHGIEGAGPSDAVAVVNPVRDDSRFTDKSISGVHTAWLTMCAVRQKLMNLGRLPDNTPSLNSLLDYVALGSVADCSDLGGSRNNRLVVNRGLHLMNTSPRPCWQALRETTGIHRPFDATDIGFSIGSRINARGRMDEAMAGVRFLRAQTYEQALALAQELESNNNDRKATEKVMREFAINEALRMREAGMRGLALWLPEGHAGVHGIVSSRVVEALGAPTVCISPKAGHPDLASGSVRTRDGFHVRNALARISEAAPGLLLAWGGHAGAGGLTLRRKDIPAFQALWDEQVRESGVSTEPFIASDGPAGSVLDIGLLAEISALGPFGRGFEAPVFDDVFIVQSVREVGEGKHFKLDLRPAAGGPTVAGIWFNPPSQWRQRMGQGIQARLAYTLDANEFRGNTSLQAVIKAGELD